MLQLFIGRGFARLRYGYLLGFLGERVLNKQCLGLTPGPVLRYHMGYEGSNPVCLVQDKHLLTIIFYWPQGTYLYTRIRCWGSGPSQALS